jgi:multidrug efflux pump subunit AcrA (membrane-fusion protein)
VTLVYPTLDPATRTVQLRLKFPNPDLTLKPEMFGEVLIDSDLGQRLGIPDSAVMDTGTRRIVFVKTGPGVFEPREVTTGVRLSDLCEIRSGVKEGEEVVTSANFFLDSESRLGAALAGAPPAAPHAGDHP